MWHMQPGSQDIAIIRDAFTRSCDYADVLGFLANPEHCWTSIEDLAYRLYTSDLEYVQKRSLEQAFSDYVRQDQRPLTCQVCGPIGKLLEVVDAALGPRPWVRLSDTSRAHLKRQRTKSGACLKWAIEHDYKLSDFR
jgi:hypothetical protein